MKFTIKIPGLSLYPGTAKHWWENASGDDIRTVARRAEQLGFEYFSVSEHIVLNREWSTEMGPRWAHSLSAAGVLLGATERVKVVCLLVLPYHHPLELAKAVATLDYLSGGRIIVQALVGYNDWEFDALGVPFDSRGAMTDEYLDVMRELWTQDAPRYHGKFVTVEPDYVMEPRPRGHVPIWLGGRTRATIRRLARIGDGWIPYVTPRAEFPQMLEYLYGLPDYLANPRPLELGLPMFEGEREPYSHKVVRQANVVLDRDVILQQIAEISALGATITDADEVLGTGKFQNDLPGAAPPTRSLADYLERLEWFAEEIMPSAKDM